MGKFTTEQILLTQEQKRKLIESSNTYHRKYDARLVQMHLDGKPIDSFIVQYKVSIDAPEPVFDKFSWGATRNEIERIIGKFF